jgi:hypothetical protein
VNVNVTNIVNFTSWQLDLYYLNAVLNCTSAVEGPFLNWDGAFSTYFSQTINNNYNSTYGCLIAWCMILGMDSVNGSGVILTVSFTAVGAGSSYLTLADTVLGDTEIPAMPIFHTDFSGVVNVTGAPHDVAVSYAASDKTIVGQGYSDNITATAANLGGYTETFNVTVYANATVVVSQNVTLSNVNSANLTFTWDTTGFAYGIYAISVYAWPVPGETNTANNNFTCGFVTLTIPGDVDGNGRVNMGDVVDILLAFGSVIGMPNYRPNCDIDDNGRVNMGDVVIALTHFGQHYP